MDVFYSESADSRNTYHHGDLYRSLLEAALNIIEENGLEGLSLRKMASRCKVSQTAPYRHFASKEHLLAVLAERGCVDLLESMTNSLSASSSSWVDNISNLLAAYVHFAQEHCSYFQMIFNLRTLDRSNYPSLNKAMAQHCALFMRVLEQGGFSKDDAKEYAHHFWAYAHGMATLIINRQWSSGAHKIDIAAEVKAFVASLSGKHKH